MRKVVVALLAAALGAIPYLAVEAYTGPGTPDPIVRVKFKRIRIEVPEKLTPIVKADVAEFRRRMAGAPDVTAPQPDGSVCQFWQGKAFLGGVCYSPEAEPPAGPVPDKKNAS